MRIAVIGAGAMGRWAVKELGISPQVDEIVVGDVNEEQARAVATIARRRQGAGPWSSTRATRRASRRRSPAATR